MKALFLDRDGVINVDSGYIYKIADFEFIDGIFELLKEAQNRNYLLIVVTNQSGIAKNYYSEQDFKILTAYMVDEFLEMGIKITKVYHCPHQDSDNCDCRKPKSGMILEAIKKFGIDVNKSIMIGDKERDIISAKNAKVKYTILLNHEDVVTEASYKIDNLSEAISILQKIDNQN